MNDKIFAMLVTASGFAIVAVNVSFLAAVGVLIFVWGNNLERVNK